ncbi:hypothetical protein W97_09181 [Coniosporium apollinis CBS 100218]|uniref:RRM domain-containing protein n=1 Tax=Coniosporium apollinis (strain CBS 100218) TaxID=1168221 RepID=R7Z6X6_CONA1|nr:uncharacterized protein W97_09181 [Coniosporium apollinis CBS 100218]EON69917.1 hypothetical protein W97_09181 [Coniosporium apollinis CBS 100218]
MERKPKGFGYVEFGTLDGLKKALDLSGTQFQGRNIRVTVADPPKDRPEGREINDWTRKGPLPDLPNARRTSERGGGGYRAFDAGSDAGSERGERRRPPPFEGDGKVRDFGNWERKGPLSPVPPTGGPMRDGGRLRSRDGPPVERRNSPSWGEGRSQDGSRPPRREFQERPAYDRQPTAPELDNQWRSRMKPDAPAKSPGATPETSTPSSPAATPAPPTQRPRLNLAKRTVSEAQPAADSGSSDSKASPFGAAKPIDTAAREKEVEEKRQLAIRQKKEADEKAREERRAKEAAAKAEKANASQEGSKDGTQEESKENGGGSPPAEKNYEILRRMEKSGEGNVEEEQAEDSANGAIVDDQSVKPKEIVRDPKKDQGTWRRKPSAPTANATGTAEGLEEEGWSTVSSKPKNSRRGGRHGAVAS